MDPSLSRPRPTHEHDAIVRDVRDSAAAILAAVGTAKLHKIALFRATKWATLSIKRKDREGSGDAGMYWVRATEWLRIAWALSSPSTTCAVANIIEPQESGIRRHKPSRFPWT